RIAWSDGRKHAVDAAGPGPSDHAARRFGGIAATAKRLVDGIPELDGVLRAQPVVAGSAMKPDLSHERAAAALDHRAHQPGRVIRKALQLVQPDLDQTELAVAPFLGDRLSS